MSAERRHYDVVIVGTGVTGSLAVDHFVRQGRSVCVIEIGRDEPYFPRTHDDLWQERTRTEIKEGRILTKNHWDGAETYRGPLVRIENRNADFRFDYNMKLGYGGSGAVWTGIIWRLFKEDFKTQSLYGYGRDWPFSYEALSPYYDRVEQLFRASGPQDREDWPWQNAYPSPAFPMSYGSSVIAKAVAPHFTLTPFANAVRNAPELEGGCVGARNCTRFCPANAVYRPYQHLLEPHRSRSNLDIIFEAQVHKLSADANGRIDGVHFIRHGKSESVQGTHVFLCGNTVENIRVLLNSARHADRPLADSSGMLGRYFATHGTFNMDIEVKEPLYVGRGRKFDATGINVAASGRRERVNAHMLEVLNQQRFHYDADMAFMALRQRHRFWGRDLFVRAEALNRRTSLVVIYEMEMRSRNRIALSEHTDENGVPIALADIELSDRDRATLEQCRTYREAFAANEHTNWCEITGWGLNGNHPLGGTPMGTSKRNGVIDRHSRSFDHDNLYILGGGGFSSTGCFNPTETIAALALMALDDPRLRAL